LVLQHERAGIGGSYPVLHSYVVYTFAKLKEQADTGRHAIAETSHDGKRWACFDTGLATPQQQHFYALFGENHSDISSWYWHGFHCLSDRQFPWRASEAGKRSTSGARRIL
jgi:hypothetical protein